MSFAVFSGHNPPVHSAHPPPSLFCRPRFHTPLKPGQPNRFSALSTLFQPPADSGRVHPTIAHFVRVRSSRNTKPNQTILIGQLGRLRQGCPGCCQRAGGPRMASRQTVPLLRLLFKAYGGLRLRIGFTNSWASTVRTTLQRSPPHITISAANSDNLRSDVSIEIRHRGSLARSRAGWNLFVMCPRAMS